MYRDWPFFRALLSNTQISLAKAEMDIAQEYIVLVLKTRELAHARLCAYPGGTRPYPGDGLQVADIRCLLEETPTLALSLTRRDPYLDPLNHIQIKLLDRYPQR